MDYFAGLDISMDETHVCVRRSRRRGRSREQDGVDGSRRSRANWRKRQVVVASYSRRGEWRRSCFTG